MKLKEHNKVTFHYKATAGKNESFELFFQQYHRRIRNYLSMKVDSEIAEDLTQQVFIKAMNHFHTFREEANPFTWLFTIAQNTLKNEYRRISRSRESFYDPMDMPSQFIAVDFTNNIEFRIDLQAALQQMSPLDQQIISLRFFVECTFLEISEIIQMRESAVKNRLYRSLAKLKQGLDKETVSHMSMEQMISIVCKHGSLNNTQTNNKVIQDVLNELKLHMDRLIDHLQHRSSQKIIIEMYPDLPSFHIAVGEANAPNWFMGMTDKNKIKVVSPLNPGPEHTYESVLKSTVHLFTMWLIKDINPQTPKWLRQGLGGYEAGLMTAAYINKSITNIVQQGTVPTFQQLNQDTWEFEVIKGFQFSYKIVEFLIQEYGYKAINQWIRKPSDFKRIFQCSKAQLYELWLVHLKNEYASEKE